MIRWKPHCRALGVLLLALSVLLAISAATAFCAVQGKGGESSKAPQAHSADQENGNELLEGNPEAHKSPSSAASSGSSSKATSYSSPNPSSGPFRVLQVALDGAVTPAMQELLVDVLDTARSESSDLVLLALDTPGGLAESMREMVRSMLGSPVPIAVWVGPSGGRAASAGVFLVAASTVSAMAPNTTIGAASPVDMGGGDMDETMARKVKNDIMSLVRSVAKAHGRNVEWYEQAVDESVSVTAQEAVMLRVVEYVAVSPQDMLEQMAGSGVSFHGEPLSFDPDHVTISEYEPGFRYEFLSWLLNPTIAYMLLLGGMAGLFFELTSPGAVFPGVFGGICLLLALYALAILPTNIAGLLLILFGLLLFGLEVKITSFGLLGVGGALCLFVGSVILFRGGGPGMAVPLTMVLSTVITLSIFLGLVVRLVLRARNQAYPTGESAMIGMIGSVRSWEGQKGTIMIRGEIWSAHVDGDVSLSIGDRVRVVSVDGLELLVEPSANG